MKKVLIYFVTFIFICFILPALVTKRDISTFSSDNQEIQVENNQESNQQGENQNSSNQETTEYNYQKYGTIKLLHAKTGQVEEVALDDYLCNVVSAEMPADYELEEFKIKNMKMRTYVMLQLVVKHGFQRKIGLLDGKKAKERVIGKKYSNV